MENASHPITLTDVAEVIEAARDVLRPFDHDTTWWRGHAKADWRLQAHVHRRDPKRQYDETTLIGLRRDNQDENHATIRMRIRRRGDDEGRA